MSYSQYQQYGGNPYNDGGQAEQGVSTLPLHPRSHAPIPRANSDTVDNYYVNSCFSMRN